MLVHEDAFGCFRGNLVGFEHLVKNYLGLEIQVDIFEGFVCLQYSRDSFPMILLSYLMPFQR